MQQPINRGDPNGTDFFECCWDEMSNRSLMSPFNLGSIAGGYQGNTAGISSTYATWKGTQAYNERWINSPYNVGYLTPAHNASNSTLYRSISEPEATSIEATGEFSLLEGQMEAKQFALNEAEAWTFGDRFGNSTVVSVEIDTKILNDQFGISMTIDPFIFRHGVVTIHDYQMNDFNRLIYNDTIRLIRK